MICSKIIHLIDEHDWDFLACFTLSHRFCLRDFLDSAAQAVKWNFKWLQLAWQVYDSAGKDWAAVSALEGLLNIRDRRPSTLFYCGSAGIRVQSGKNSFCRALTSAECTNILSSCCLDYNAYASTTWFTTELLFLLLLTWDYETEEVRNVLFLPQTAQHHGCRGNHCVPAALIIRCSRTL